MSKKPKLIFDADDMYFLARELENLRPQIYEKKYPEFKARQILPVVSGEGSFDYLVTQQLDWQGKAQFIGAGADDLPNASVTRGEAAYKVEVMGSGYGITLQEFRRAQGAQARGRSLPDLMLQRTLAARRAVEQLIDDVGASGNSSAGLPGFINNSLITPANVANPGSGTTWAVKTPDQILTDLNEIVSSIRNASKGVHSPDTIVMPELQYTQIAQKRLTDSDGRTVLDFFLSTNPFVKTIMPWHKLEDVGAGTTDRMIAYSRSTEFLEFAIPSEVEVLPMVQKTPLKQEGAVIAATAGVIIHYPTSVAYRDGI